MEKSMCGDLHVYISGPSLNLEKKRENSSLFSICGDIALLLRDWCLKNKK